MNKMIIIFLILLIGVACVAQEPVQDPAVPSWLERGLDILVAIPFVGPWLAKILVWVGVIASVLTAVATAFFAVVKSLTKVLSLMKLVGFAQKIEVFYQKIAPFLMFFSIYNVKLPKKEEVKNG